MSGFVLLVIFDNIHAQDFYKGFIIQYCQCYRFLISRVDVNNHEPFWLPSFTKRYMDLVGGRYHKVIAGEKILQIDSILTKKVFSPTFN